MSYRYDDLAAGEVYHVFTRGVEHRNVFLDDVDRNRFVALLVHCLPKGRILSFSSAKRAHMEASLTREGEGIADILGYCLMTNHVHLLVHQNVDNGISLYMLRLLTSYARYFNVRRIRSGSLFINPFKAVLISKDEELLHVSRYIHLNPYSARMVNDVHGYFWSSLAEYISPARREARCHRGLLSSMMKPLAYKSFVEDEADYQRSLADYEHLLVDMDD